MFSQPKIDFASIYLKVEAAEKLQEADDTEKALTILSELAENIQKSIPKGKKSGNKEEKQS